VISRVGRVEKGLFLGVLTFLCIYFSTNAGKITIDDSFFSLSPGSLNICWVYKTTTLFVNRPPPFFNVPTPTGTIRGRYKIPECWSLGSQPEHPSDSTSVDHYNCYFSMSSTCHVYKTVFHGKYITTSTSREVFNTVLLLFWSVQESYYM
jgi:hypothetical protein